MEPELFSTTQVAHMLGISRVAVLKKIQSGTILAQKIGRNFVIRKADLPFEVGGKLTEQKKHIIDKAVQRTVSEYGEALRLLGKE